MHHQNEQIFLLPVIGILDAPLVVTGCPEEMPIQVRPEPAVISQIWIRDHATKLVLEGMIEIVRTRQRGIVNRAPLEVP